MTDPTPNGTRVYAERADGTRVDVTDGVSALYDHCVSSMDWGSGFLTIEDAAGIIRVAQQCGYLVPDTAAREFEGYARQDNTAYLASNGELNMPTRGDVTCVVCNAPVVYVPDYYADKSVYIRAGRPPGWSHADLFLDTGHLAKLWKDA
jgi:hypothetical protein